MNKLPTVKLNGKTAFVIDRHHVEDDIAVAEAISRDAARYRWLRDHHKKNQLDTEMFVAGADGYYIGSDLDSAIDAAMKKGE